ncbi:hypothetical protein VOI54_12535 [Tamlana sp. 2201CG12-4]|uniref:hypothetical protein n=1 Tax=Tamlana sp. 2201CG12-4 TaxID=3112582 RepID=UPI002DBC0DAC|nr:hypothetical protein [Tamlana sp. 2201CG12-4]MEC3907848.1 hypothetical protein [Tamlana sp. 2201CG12-4]
MKKKYILYFLIFVINLSFGQQNISVAKKTIDSLKYNSKRYHGVSINKYSIKDINKNGISEIIEKVNETEQDAVGFLNNEIYPAFEFHKIYKFENGKFTESYIGFESYLTERKKHYVRWKNLIENPESLNSDSRGLIAANKVDFLKEIDRLIKLIDGKMK